MLSELIHPLLGGTEGTGFVGVLPLPLIFNPPLCIPDFTIYTTLNREATLKTATYYFRITEYSAKICYSSSKSITACFQGGVVIRFLTARRQFWTPWWERTYGMENRQSFFSLAPQFTDFFTDFEKKTDCFAVYFTPNHIFLKKSQVTYWLWSNKTLRKRWLRATRGARNPNIQVFITHAPYVCSHHSFGLPLLNHEGLVTFFPS